ncbi:MAG: ABC transporter permease [Oscillospiraceae bacterium]
MNRWEFVDKEIAKAGEDTKPSLTYLQDVWRRFRSNIMAVIGLVMITIIVALAIFAPMFSKFSYSQQQLSLGNVPQRLQIVKLSEDLYVFVHSEYKLIEVTPNGKVLGSPKPVKKDTQAKQTTYNFNGTEVILDYGKAADKELVSGELKYDLLVNGKQVSTKPYKTVSNKTNPLGTDKLGRDVWVRVLYGARISLLVGVVAAVVNAVVGIIYGGISGYAGRKVDNLMMRFVDLLNSIPLMIIVVLIMVMTNKSGVGTIIFTIGLVYWVGMARQVRGQVMALKEQEFVLAAKALGAKPGRIIFRHLIPNALGPIIVTMMMSIPSAIFTESFLSFVGLGVSAPMASWGTLANDALGGIRTFPYLLIAPSVAIALTIFAFNFVGDGLRDALDPKQRK